MPIKIISVSTLLDSGDDQTVIGLRQGLERKNRWLNFEGLDNTQVAMRVMEVMMREHDVRAVMPSTATATAAG